MPKFTKTPVAENIPFNNVGKKFNADQSQAAIEEVRSNQVLSFDNLTSTLNGNHNITEQDSNIHLVSGTATGYSVTLPDATALFIGRRFEVNNTSSATILLKDNSGTTLRELISGDIAVCTLQAKGSAAGTWAIALVSGSASGITSYSIGSDTLFSTTSATDVLITGMTITPTTGRYAIWFSSDIEISQNNKLADVVLFKGGSVVSRSRREVQGVSSNFKAAFNTIAEISVNGSEAIDVRVNISGGTLNVNQRRLVLIRLGA